MYGGATRQRHRRALTVGAAVAVAIAAAGCGSGASTGSNASTVPIVTGEQVVTACFQNYFYNGVLPKAAAETNCRACVVDRLRKLGVRPTAGESVIDMLTGDRLSNSTSQAVQNGCTESDANEQ